MKHKLLRLIIFTLLLWLPDNLLGQEKNKKISFYGGFGLSLATDNTYISLQPGALYNFSEKFKLGAGVQYTYLKSNKSYYGVNYKYNILGFNTMILTYPFKGMEISGEFEDLYVKQNFNGVENNFWSPALFGGLGYRYGPIVIGFKYNFLYKPDTSIYQDAFVPFVRIYF
jgi:hypothetical protein